MKIGKFKRNDFIYIKSPDSNIWNIGQIDHITDNFIHWRFIFGNICELTSSSFAQKPFIENNGILATPEQIILLSNEVEKYCNMKWDGSCWKITYEFNNNEK